MSYTPPAGNNVVLDIGGSYTPPAGDNVNLNFSDANYKDRSLSIGFVLSKPQISASLTAATVAHINAGLVLNAPVIQAAIYAAEPPAAEYVITAHLVLNKPVIAAMASYESNVSRPLVSDAGSTWQRGEVATANQGYTWQIAEKYRDEIAGIWTHGDMVTASMRLTWQLALQQREYAVSGWQYGECSTSAANEQYGETVPVRGAAVLPWQKADNRSTSHNDKFKDLYRVRAAVECNWQHGKPFTLAWRFGFSIADWINTVQAIVWEQARKPPIGRSKSNPVIPPKPPEYQGTPFLNFLCEMCCIDPLDIQLNFGEEPCPINHKTIFIMNEISLKRVSDDVEIEIQSANVSIDKNSWCWAFSGSIPKSELHKVRPGGTGPVEVELSVNGYQWRFIIESYNENKQFANTTVAIQGRSVTALLDAPYAAVRSYTEVGASYARTLAENELTRNGEASSFTLNWQLIDELGWLIPANVFNYANLTPVTAIKAIAESVGGYVNSDPVARTLHIQSEYAFPAWQLSEHSPDKTINYDFVTSESLKWSAKPEYDKVFVSGENNGVLAAVIKTGTAGANEAPMVVNQLITDAAAARQRGIVELSRGGKQADITIELPLIADVGLCLPSEIVDFEAACGGGCTTDLEPWRGIVNGVAIAATNSGGKVTVLQTVELERRYLE